MQQELKTDEISYTPDMVSESSRQQEKKRDDEPTRPWGNEPWPKRQPEDDKDYSREVAINKPTPFSGDRKKIEDFIQECRVYLKINKNVYRSDDAKVAFILSYMNTGEALKWKKTYLKSITDDEGDMDFPPIKEFVKILEDYF